MSLCKCGQESTTTHSCDLMPVPTVTAGHIAGLTVCPHGVHPLDANFCQECAAAFDAVAALATARAELREAVDLLCLGTKYVIEDRAVTPGVTRLARWTDKARAFLARHDARTPGGYR